MSRIAEELNGKGVKTTRGLDWAVSSVRNILKNEVYVGDVVFNKTPSKNVITGETDKEWQPKLVRDHHKGIVDRATWDKAQALLKDKELRRKEILENEFHIPITKEIEEGMQEMCNLGSAIEYYGAQAGQVKLIMSTMRKQGWDVDKTLDIMDVDMKERPVFVASVRAELEKQADARKKLKETMWT